MDVREICDLKRDIPRHFYEIARLRFIRSLVDYAYPEPHSIMDVGCGDCFVLHSLAADFPKCSFVGIDTALTPEMIQTISRYGDDSRVFISNDGNLKIHGKFDLVMLFDVLEHIEDELQFLADLKSCMLPDGKIIITVPAYQKLFSDHDRFLKHFRRYSRNQLNSVLQKAGLEVQCSGYIFCSLLPFRLLQKIFRTPSKENDTLRTGNQIFNSIAAWILKLDAKILFAASRKKIYIPGLSCFAVAGLAEKHRY